ncbi:dihydrodipicolinate reductase [Marivivens marinus]|uniref:dihydrodipicolinate reductase n=1 Tax=Marivivens marinus TaxID=3110173 RepID=UPI003B846651
MRALLFALLLPTTALADGFVPITDRETFLSYVQDRDLRLGVLGITLNVDPDGTIAGTAVRWEVTGTWDWKDGFFCREMDWSGMPIDYNCQLVEVRDGSEMRFTVDQGAGDSATFRLR